MTVKHYQQLLVWQRSLDLVTFVYKLTRTFPSDEAFGLKSQMRRAAVSIPSNIAEGQGRASTGEFRQFLGHARGSLYELETQAQIALRLGYLSPDNLTMMSEPMTEIGKMLNGLVAALPVPLKMK